MAAAETAAAIPSRDPVTISLTFRITTIPTEVTAARVFELAVAFGADADHVGHDRAHRGLSVGC
jgi:hypothetical protein